jgi:hypothetical protein
MSGCDAELCANWTGQGCICEVLDLPRRVIPASDLDLEDQDTYCDSCGAEPGDPCAWGCGCLPCSLGTVDRIAPGSVSVFPEETP